jgi:hypothetical protein
MPYNAWTKIDNGREGLWDLDVWLGVLEIVSRHEGESFYDENSPIYQELEAKHPGKGWKKYDNDANGVRQFRPLFRDYPKPWTNTGTLSLEDQKISLTALGRSLVAGGIGPAEVFKRFLLNWTENGERPFQILASAILEAKAPLDFHDFYFGVMQGYRPGDDIAASLTAARQNLQAQPDRTEERRLKLLLKIMEHASCITAVAGEKWIAWDKELLKTIARQSVAPSTAAINVNWVDVPVMASSDAAVAGLRVANELIARFISSLLAKRFLILTGLSGSGKTKLAHAFAAWIAETEDQYRLVAVGADWTTNENVVGYQDALQAGVYRKPSNGGLDVILRAESDPARPYFLILDEMNLSHVERYFANILSAIESGQEIALHSAAGNLNASEHDPLPVPPKLRLPDNLFIVGTVNVDETTYMFSPKVLDRANVIEFRATAGDIAAFLDAPSKVDMDALAGKGAAFGQAFVAEAAAEAKLDGATATDLKARLTEIFGALAPIGAEFGFRTAHEITRFTHFHAKLSGGAWQLKDALDAQVLQKLLPKLHGSERRLGPVLKTLEAFCETHQCAASLEKIRRMQDRLKDGFTSFAEA